MHTKVSLNQHRSTDWHHHHHNGSNQHHKYKKKNIRQTLSGVKKSIIIISTSYLRQSVFETQTGRLGEKDINEPSPAKFRSASKLINGSILAVISNRQRRFVIIFRYIKHILHAVSCSIYPIESFRRSSLCDRSFHPFALVSLFFPTSNLFRYQFSILFMLFNIFIKV